MTNAELDELERLGKEATDLIDFCNLVCNHWQSLIEEIRKLRDENEILKSNITVINEGQAWNGIHP